MTHGDAGMTLLIADRGLREAQSDYAIRRLGASVAPHFTGPIKCGRLRVVHPSPELAFMPRFDHDRGKEPTSWRSAAHHRSGSDHHRRHHWGIASSATALAQRGPEPPPGGPDWAAIALLITAIGGMISGIITAVTGLVVALRKPGKAVDKAAEDNTPA